MSGALGNVHTWPRVPRAIRRASAAMPIGRSNVRTRGDSPPPAARTASSLFAWYVLTSSDAPRRCSSATNASDWAYRNSTGAGGAVAPGAGRTFVDTGHSLRLALTVAVAVALDVVVADRADPGRVEEGRVRR